MTSGQKHREPELGLNVQARDINGIAKGRRGDRVSYAYKSLLATAIAALLVWLVAARESSSREPVCQLGEPRASGWRMATIEGVSWLVNPCGDRSFSLGVNIVTGGEPHRNSGGRIHYSWPQYYRSFNAWERATGERLRVWGFNTLGGWSIPSKTLDLPATIELSLGRDIGFFWRDPFNPVEETRLRTAVHQRVRPWRDNAYRIGYFSDNEVGWWNGPLFTVYTAFAPENHSKRRLVALLRQLYDDDWSKFVADFVPPDKVDSFHELLASRSPTHLRPGGVGIRAIRAWTRDVAHQYYRIIAEQIRADDPKALVFGDRLPIYYDADAVRAMTPYVDAIAVNYNADGPDGWIARYFFEGLRQLTTGKPVLVTEWFFAAHENRSGNRNVNGLPQDRQAALSTVVGRAGHLMTVATQAERAAGAAAAARRMAEEPNVVGLHWFQYFDEPRGGRVRDGEDYNFGLVDIDDRPYELLTNTFRELNPLLPQMHAKGAEHPGGRAIPYGSINATDDSLVEWPKDEAVLWPLTPQPDEAVFGDVYMAWDERGLSLATIAMDYYDPSLLKYDGAFPPDEAFRIDLGIEADRGPRRFRLEIEPQPWRPGEMVAVRARLCTPEPGGCKDLPGAEARYFGLAVFHPRVIAEAKLPWSAIGLEKPPASVKVEVAVTTFYRSRWMSLSGLPPTQAIAEPARWTLLPLTRR